MGGGVKEWGDLPTEADPEKFVFKFENDHTLTMNTPKGEIGLEVGHPRDTIDFNQTLVTFAKLRQTNLDRQKEWHTPETKEWTLSDWGVAMAGEAGEVCDAIKKYNRITGGFANISAISTEAEAIAAIGKEVADTIIYLDLLANVLGIDVGKAVTDKFNEVSDKYGFKTRM